MLVSNPVATHDHQFLYPSASGSKVVGGASNGSLDRGGTVRLNFDLPVEGITITLVRDTWCFMHQSVQQLQTLL